MRWTSALLAALLLFAAPPLRAADSDGRDRRLVDTYRAMLADDPDQEYALRRLLEVSHAVGGLGGLVRLYEADLATAPDRFGDWMVLGHLERAAEDEAGAVAAYERAAALRPKAPGPALARAALYRKLRRWDEALAAFDAAAPLVRDLAARQELLRAAAETAIEGELPERAEGYFEALVATEPQNLFLRMQYASTLAKVGSQQRALALWQDLEERARGQLKHLVIVWKEVAELQTALGMLDAAEATWRRALERTPVGHWERRTFVDGLIGHYRRLDRLEVLIAELEPQAGTQYELLVTLARLHEELADDARALARYREALAQRPSDVQVRLAALRLLERVGTPEEVLGAWEELVRATPGEPRHELHLAELYFQRAKAAEAEALMKRISSRYAADPGVHQHLVELWLRYGDPAARRQVEAEYKILARLEPEEEAHVISLGEYYWSLDDRPRALATWKRLLTLKNNRPEGLFTLAEVYADHDLVDEARAAFEQAIALAPAEQRFARGYALLLERLGKPAEALVVWRGLLEQAPASGGSASREARRRVIALWDASKQLPAELERLEVAFAATPPDPTAGALLAEAYLHERRLDDAERVYGRLHALAPQAVEPLVGLEQIHTRQNDLPKVIAVLEDLARVDSSGAGDYLQRAADHALALGDAAQALRFARRVAELRAADPEAQTRLGDLHLRLGLRAEAAEAWRQALALDPRNDAVRFKLASLYRDLGQAGREEQLLSALVREARDPADAQRAGRRLLTQAAARGRLASVEALLAPVALSGRARPVDLELLVDVYAALGQEALVAPIPPSARAAALAALGERALRPLTEALANADVAVRSRALDVLELTRPPGAAPALIRLLGDPDPAVQVQAAAALGRIGSQAAVAGLARLAASAKLPERDLGTWALGLTSSAEAGQALAQRLAQAQLRERPTIAAAIGHGRAPGSLAALLPLAQDRFPEVRLAALWASARLADPAAVPVLGRVLVVGDAREAHLAAWGLSRLDPAIAAQGLVEALFASAALPEDSVWAALGASGAAIAADDPSTEAIYQRALVRERGLVTGPRPELFVVTFPAPERAQGGSVVRRWRALIEGRIGAVLARGDDPTVSRLLAALLAGPSLSLVTPGRFPGDAPDDAAATRAILAVHTEALLARTGADQSESVAGLALAVAARLAMEAPEALSPTQVATAARQALGRGPAVRLGALDAIARVGAPRDRALLQALEQLADISSAAGGATASDAEVRAALARALGRVGGGGLTPGLEALLADPWAGVRRAAVEALGDGGDALTERLVGLVADPAREVALAAVAALGRQSGARARQALEGVATGGPAHLRPRARASLPPMPQAPPVPSG